MTNNNAIATLNSYGILADPKRPLVMYAVDGHESHDLVLADAKAQENATIVQGAMKAGKLLDFMSIYGLAMLKRDGAHKDSGYESFGQFAEALTGMNRTTACSYANAGDTFLDKAGEPVKPFVKKVSVAVLNQLSGLLKAGAYVYRARVDFDFIEVIFKHYNYSLSVARVNDLIKILKRGEIPSDLVKEEVREDGTHFMLCDLDSGIELVGYTKPDINAGAGAGNAGAGAGNAGAGAGNAGAGAGNAGAGAGNEKTITEVVSDAVTALGKLPMSDDLKARYDVMYKTILSLTADIVAYKPTQATQEQAKQEQATQEQEQATQEQEQEQATQEQEQATQEQAKQEQAKPKAKRK